MATIKDVAKLAGVSVSAVSKAFNAYSDISGTTKDKIFQAAKALDYVPNKAAVELSSGRHPYIGLILHMLDAYTAINEHIIRLLCGVHERAAEIKHELVLYTSHQIRDMELSYVEFCRHHSLIGAIIHGVDVADKHMADLSESDIPCVMIDHVRMGKSTASIAVDNCRAAEDVMDLLYSAGHRKICHIMGYEGYVTDQRKQGVLLSARKNMIPSTDIIFVKGDFREDVAYESTKKILNMHPDLRAIFAASDIMALGAQRAIIEHGYMPGKDFSLVGFDGLSTLQYTTPPIATVFQDFHEMGRLGVDTLLRIAKGQSFAPVNHVRHTLIERGSIRQ